MSLQDGSAAPREVPLDGEPITDLPRPEVKDLEPSRDKVRAVLALGLLSLLALIVVLAFVLVFWPPPALAREDPGLESRTLFVQGLFGSVVGLFGAAAGFYFGSSSK